MKYIEDRFQRIVDLMRNNACVSSHGCKLFCVAKRFLSAQPLGNITAYLENYARRPRLVALKCLLAGNGHFSAIASRLHKIPMPASIFKERGFYLAHSHRKPCLQNRMNVLSDHFFAL